MTDYAEIDESTGKLTAIDWRKIKLERRCKIRDGGISRVISEFAFDRETGELTKFKRDDRLNAIAQLRDMHGFKAVTKIAPTSPGSLWSPSRSSATRSLDIGCGPSGEQTTERKRCARPGDVRACRRV
jgi:hypothetical protein